MHLVRFLVAGIYICGMALMFSLGLILNGIGLDSLLRCKIGIYICLSWYVLGNKVLMYAFLFGAQ